MGLMGLEIFDQNGRPVTVSNKERQIWADPPDINALPEYDNDPRTVDNLLDEVNLTCDDLHAWLAPFTPGQSHFVWLDFDAITTISMIRIWNYNKSRIHSYRGARYIEISLDSSVVFKGEIRKAIGSHSIYDFESCSECILFTTDNRILSLIENNDPIMEKLNQEKQEKDDEERTIKLSEASYPLNLLDDKQTNRVDYYEKVRPLSFSRANNVDTNGIYEKSNEEGQPLRQPHFASERPTTAAGNKSNSKDQQPVSNYQSERLLPPRSKARTRSFREIAMAKSSPYDRPSTANLARSKPPIMVSSIDICILSSWDHTLNVVGLSLLKGIDDRMNDFLLPLPRVYLGSILQTQTGQFTISRSREIQSVIPIRNIVSQNDDNTWTISYSGKESIILRFTFPDKRSMKVSDC